MVGRGLNRGVPQATVGGGAHFSGHVPIKINTQMTVLGYGPSVFDRFLLASPGEYACTPWPGVLCRLYCFLPLISGDEAWRKHRQRGIYMQIYIRYLSIQNTGTVAEVSINPKETIFQPMFLMKFSLSGLILLEYSLTMLKNPAFSRGRPHGGGPEQTRPKNERSGPDQDPTRTRPGPDQDPTRTRPGPDQRREITRPA